MLGEWWWFTNDFLLRAILDYSPRTSKRGCPTHVTIRYDDGLPRSSIHSLSTIAPPSAGTNNLKIPAFTPPPGKISEHEKEKKGHTHKRYGVESSELPHYILQQDV